MVKLFAARGFVACIGLAPVLACAPAISCASLNGARLVFLQEGAQTKTAPVRVSAAESEKLLIKKTDPERYPPWAKHNGVEGTVNLEFTVTAEGRVTDVTPTSGDPLLINVSKECVEKWEYRPYILKGQPTPMRTTTWIKFELHPQKITVGSNRSPNGGDSSYLPS